MIPNNAPIIQLLRPATDEAVMRAIHKSSPIKWHKAYATSPELCPFCHDGEQTELSKKIEGDLVELDGLVMAPWQRKLALEMLAAKSDELDAVVEEAVISPALAAYLDEHELVPDSKPEIIIDEVTDWVVVHRSKEDQAQPEQFTLVDSEVIHDDGTHTVVVGSYGEMTAKALRPLASAAGMKGARVASKADLVAYLNAQ